MEDSSFLGDRDSAFIRLPHHYLELKRKLTKGGEIVDEGEDRRRGGFTEEAPLT